MMAKYKLKQNDREANAAYWDRRSKNHIEYKALERYSEVVNEDLDALRQRVGTYHAVASYVDEAIDLMILGEIEDSLSSARVAAKAANKAIEEEDFRWATRNSEFASIYNAEGGLWCNLYLHYAKWVLTGQRDWDIWRKGIESGFCARALDRWSSRDYLMEMCVQYEKFDDVISLSRKSDSKQYQALALICQWQEGDESKEELAKEKLEYWYLQSQKWHINRADLVWWGRLMWGWLHGRYISGITELQPMLQELKGC